jgi:hypothetical protein
MRKVQYWNWLEFLIFWLIILIGLFYFITKLV